MSGMLAPMGIISGPMAEYFAQPVTVITAKFGWLTFGILIGAIVALLIFDLVRLRNVLIGVYATILACLLTLTLPVSISFIGPPLGLVGACCGIGLAAAALVISRTYDDERRASMLVITDGSFSVAGIVCSWVAVLLVVRGVHWAGVYQFVAIISLLVVLLSLASEFPEAEASGNVPGDHGGWPVAVWLCIASLFLYTLGQWAFLLWLPNHAETLLGAARESAGQIVSQYWTGMFATQVFVSWWVLRIGVRRLVLLVGVSTTLFSVPLWLLTDVDSLIVISAVWGFMNLGLLKIVLSFATQMLRVPTGRLVSSLLLGATVGTAVSPWVTSQIVAATNTRFVMQFGTGCFALLTIFLFAAARADTSSRRNPAQFKAKT